MPFVSGVSAEQLAERLDDVPAITEQALSAELDAQHQELREAGADTDRSKVLDQRTRSTQSDIAHFIGVVSAQSRSDELELAVERAAVLCSLCGRLAEAMKAARDRPDETLPDPEVLAELDQSDVEIRSSILRRAQTIALSEGAIAWTWMPRSEWTTGIDCYPWVARAETWLAERENKATEQLRASHVFWTVEELARNPVVVQDALIASMDDGPTTTAECEVLASRVCNRLRSMSTRARSIARAEAESKVRDEEPDTEAVTTRPVATVLPLELAYLEALTALGKKGREDAAKITAGIPGQIESFGTRWYGWLPEVRPVRPPRRLRVLAKLLWLYEVKPELKRDAKRRDNSHASLTGTIHEDIVKLHGRAGKLAPQNPTQLVFPDGSSMSFDRCPLLDSDTLAVVSRGMQLLGSVDAHRLLRFEVHTGFTRWIDGVDPMHVIDVEGGYGQLAEQLGIRDKGAPARLRAILMAQRMCSFPLPGPDSGTGNLIILSEWKGSGRRSGRIRIELGTMLMPNYGQDLKEVLTNRELARAKKLVPLIELPPFVGRPNDHGAQATLSMLVTREFRWRAPELVRDGGVRIGLERWAALADEARIPRSQVAQQLRPILDRWTRDGDDGPAFLKTVGKEPLYTLGDKHEAARRFLEAGGKGEIDGAKAGQKSSEARKARLVRAATRRGPRARHEG